MQAAEFDRFADDYAETHRRNVEISGEAPDYFARYKIQTLRRRWDRLGRPEPETILDFGCGVGASLPYLAALFPKSALLGLDVSERSLAIAAERAPPGTRLIHHDGGRLDVPTRGVDLIFSACVFHHIPPVEHGPLFSALHGLLKPQAALAVFEHNPLNPVTRYIVATCPFDENAELIPAGRLARRQLSAGFRHVSVRYTGFFPAGLARLRPIEDALGALPIGAQYYTFAVA